MQTAQTNRVTSLSTLPSNEITVLFICTGNIFRSMTAEYTLRASVDKTTGVRARSAGLVDAPHEVVPFVRQYLDERAIDISGHTPRKLDASMFSGADLVVAMDIAHQNAIQQQFGVLPPLFNQVAYGTDTAMPDVDEMIPDWRQNEEAARAYCHSVMDTISLGMGGFIRRLPLFLK